MLSQSSAIFHFKFREASCVNRQPFEELFDVALNRRNRSLLQIIEPFRSIPQLRDER